VVGGLLLALAVLNFYSLVAWHNASQCFTMDAITATVFLEAVKAAAGVSGLLEGPHMPGHPRQHQHEQQQIPLPTPVVIIVGSDRASAWPPPSDSTIAVASLSSTRQAIHAHYAQLMVRSPTHARVTACTRPVNCAWLTAADG
jgi:hypothetical protein